MRFLNQAAWPFQLLLPCGLSLSFSRGIKGRFLLGKPGPVSLWIYLVCSLCAPNSLFLNHIFKVHRLLLPQCAVWAGAWILEADKAWWLTQVVISQLGDLHQLPDLQASLPPLNLSTGCLRPEGGCSREWECMHVLGWGSGTLEVLRNVSYYYNY